jgi:hypothetical protein
MKTAIEQLEARLGVRWNAIRAARAKSEEIVGRLGEGLAGLGDQDCSVVVTGSLGRGEASDGSDADWVLLVDGPSDPKHAMWTRDIGACVLRVVSKEVGPTRTFARIVASHELVHYIAGTRDTNENLTHRLLLLSESRAVTHPEVRKRVIANVLARYVIHDRSVRSRSGRRQTVPLFLLNDVVRYWRTMASDYASKMWERQRQGWGIRNIKLRFSRKLLFIGGLLAAFSGELFASQRLYDAESDDLFFSMLAELIYAHTDVPPLELLARVVLQVDDREVIDAIFSSYDHFLHVLSDPAARAKLETVPFDDALDDPTYADLREASQRFRDGVTRLFFDVHPILPRLIREYGVF